MKQKLKSISLRLEPAQMCEFSRGLQQLEIAIRINDETFHDQVVLEPNDTQSLLEMVLDYMCARLKATIKETCK